MAKRIALTVDLEPDWGIRGTRALREITPLFLRFLEERGMRATFFVVSDLMDASAGLVAAWLVPRPGRSDELESMLSALVPTGMLLVSDVSLGGHLAILTVPFGALSAFCLRRGTRRAGRTVAWVTLAGLLLCHLMAFPLLKQMSTGTAGVLVLYGLMLCVAFWLWRRPTAEPPVQAA